MTSSAFTCKVVIDAHRLPELYARLSAVPPRQRAGIVRDELVRVDTLQKALAGLAAHSLAAPAIGESTPSDPPPPDAGAAVAAEFFAANPGYLPT